MQVHLGPFAYNYCKYVFKRNLSATSSLISHYAPLSGAAQWLDSDLIPKCNKTSWKWLSYSLSAANVRECRACWVLATLNIDNLSRVKSASEAEDTVVDRDFSLLGEFVRTEDFNADSLCWRRSTSPGVARPRVARPRASIKPVGRSHAAVSADWHCLIGWWSHISARWISEGGRASCAGENRTELFCAGIVAECLTEDTSVVHLCIYRLLGLGECYRGISYAQREWFKPV